MRLPSKTSAKSYSFKVFPFGITETSVYQNSVAPDDWKLHKKRKKEKKGYSQAATQCTSPFHFLTKHSDFSHKLPSLCPCSKLYTPKSSIKFSDLRSFLTKSHVQNNKNVIYPTRADLIRGAHDRGKITHT